MYVLDQPPFLNAAALGWCELGPFALLDLLKATESMIGRQSASRNAPREIDLDLITYGKLQLRSARGKRTLHLPHAQIRERRFVLAPLFDIDPHLVLPGLGPIDELLRATNSQAEDVKILDDAVLQVCRDR
jgi:2-amino-4-hydroxy-6-hydroxymethyldihydropteridine diphosphokinase